MTHPKQTQIYRLNMNTQKHEGRHRAPRRRGAPAPRGAPLPDAVLGGGAKEEITAAIMQINNNKS